MRASKVDDNQADIVKTLRALGYSVQLLNAVKNGCPDIAVGVNGMNKFYEIKDEKKTPSARKLTPMESAWHDNWKGHVLTVTSVTDILYDLNHI